MRRQIQPGKEQMLYHRATRIVIKAVLTCPAAKETMACRLELPLGGEPPPGAPAIAYCSKIRSLNTGGSQLAQNTEYIAGSVGAMATQSEHVTRVQTTPQVRDGRSRLKRREE